MDRTYLFSVTGDKVIKLVNSGCDFVRYKTSWWDFYNNYQIDKDTI